MPNEPHIFWNFSLDLYDREGVAVACLELQDLYQLDVNLVLFCVWYGFDQGQVQQSLLRDVLEFSTTWRKNVVQPLRNARSWMKLNHGGETSFASLRERIKADELAAEKYQQERVEKLVAGPNNSPQTEPGTDAAKENIDLLLQSMGIERDEKLTDCLKIILEAAGH